MDDDKRQKSWPIRSNSPRHSAGFRRALLPEETNILKAILLGETLPITLNRLCTLVDFHVGNVVSLVCLASEEETYANSIAQTARRFDLNVFMATNIISPDHCVLGTFQVFSCDRRRPRPHEAQLIERVSHLSAVALQRHQNRLEIELDSKNLRSPEGDGEPQTPPFIN